MKNLLLFGALLRTLVVDKKTFFMMRYSKLEVCGFIGSNDHSKCDERNGLLRLPLFKFFVVLVAFIFLIGWSEGVAQGNETFENLTLSGSAYSDNSFVGQNDVVWNYVQCRGDKEITGQSIMLGKDRDPASWIVSDTVAGGIGTLSFDYMQAFSTDVNLAVLVNDSVVATVTSADETDIVKSSGVVTVNVEGDVVLKFINENSTDGQVAIDNIVWSAFETSSTASLSDLVLSTSDIHPDEEISFTWTAVNVDNIRVEVKESGDDWESVDGLEEIDASLQTLAFTIPVDAQDGTYMIRIVDNSNSEVYAESTWFTITDNLFAGIEGLFPAAEAEVGTDLFFTFDEEDFISVGKLILMFGEEVIAGTGNIEITEDGAAEPAYIIDVASELVGFMGYYVTIEMPELLKPETKYYVSVDAGAVTDEAPTPNTWDGVDWWFTTTEGTSEITIADIRNESDEPAFWGQYVMTEGLVTAKNANFGFFFQGAAEAWNGIYVNDENVTPGINVGDMLKIIAMVSYTNGLAELINVSYHEPLSTGNELFDPLVVTLPFEDRYESMLVRLEGVSAVEESDAYKEFEVTDGQSDGVIDNLLYEHVATAGEKYISITGLMNYNYGQFKLAPRNAGDVLIDNGTFISEDVSFQFSIAPNPVDNILTVRASVAINSVDVVNAAGVSVNRLTNIGTDVVTVLVSSLVKGVYLVRVTDVNGDTNVVKVVKR
jgi:hypothetical protein